MAIDNGLPRRSLRLRLSELKHWIGSKIVGVNFTRESADRKGLTVRLEREVADPFNVV